MTSILKPFSNIIAPQELQVPVSAGLQIDWTHPLANGLVGCWVPGVMQGIDLTGNVVPMTPDGAGVLDMYPDGVGLKSTASGSGYQALAPAIFSGWNAFSLFYRGYQVGSVPNSGAIYIGTTFNNSNSSPFLVAALHGFNPNTFHIEWNEGGANSSLNSGSISNGPISLGGTFLVGGNVIPYINGAASSGTTTFGAATPSGTATSTVCINTFTSVTSRDTNSVCNIACAWNRALSASEMQALHLAPYDFLIPAGEPEFSSIFVQPLFTLMAQIVT